MELGRSQVTSPVTIGLAADRDVRRDGRWLCVCRRFERLLESDGR